MRTIRYRQHIAVTLCLLAVASLPASQTGAQAQGGWPTKGWAAAQLNAVGMEAGPLDALDAEIRAGKHGYVDSMLVVRCGKLVYEKTYTHDYDKIYGERAKTRGPLNHDPSGPYNYFNPDWHPFYRRGELHSMQSITKTVTSVIIGVAMARGDFPSIDTPILKFFNGARIQKLDPRMRRITIRHLLTMTAGIEWHEDLPYTDPKNSADLMEASHDWVDYAINQPMAEEPGARFNYSSGASQILSHIFKQATQRDISEYATEHFFKPLGITHYWKRTPTGLSDTEGGLYLHGQDLAKIGYLFLQNGVWDGKQLVRAEWVKDSVAAHTTVGDGPVKYGYKWWLPPYGDAGRRAWTGSGFGGQRLLVLSEEEVVMVFTGWTTLAAPLGARVAIHAGLGAVKMKGCAAH